MAGPVSAYLKRYEGNLRQHTTLAGVLPVGLDAEAAVLTRGRWSIKPGA